MPRQRLTESQKAVRRAQGRKRAAALNKKLASHLHTYAYATESGRLVVYFEPPSRPKIRIHAPFPSLEFDIELLAAKRGQPVSQSTVKPRPTRSPAPVVEHSWRWGCQEYFSNDPQYRQMSSRDKRNRRNVLEGTWAEPIFPGAPLLFGDMPLSEFNGESVLILMKRKLKWVQAVDAMTEEEREVQTNFSAANTRHKFISAVLSYLVLNQTRLVGGRNWARDIKPFKAENEDGHRTPSLEDIEKFWSVFPLGTRERLLFDLAYYTTQRRADLPRLGEQVLQKDRYGNDRLVFVQHKLRNKKRVTAYVPIFPELQRSLDAAQAAGILGDLLYLVHERGSATAPDRPYAEGALAT